MEKEMEDLEFYQTVGGGSKEHDETEDPFKLLPDGLIISHIFDKICDAKSLFFSSLVSKRFSSIVYQSKTVSIKIPLQIPPPTTLATPTKYFSNLATKFLMKFTFMRTLYVDFDCSSSGAGAGDDICDICGDAAKPPVVKWKIDLGSASFVMVYARSLNDVEEIDDEIGSDALDLITTCFLHHLKDACFRFSLMKKMVLLLPESVQNVVVTDSKKQGGLILGGSEMVDVKMIKKFNVRNFLRGKGAVKYWHARLVELPLSGSVMKRVNVIRYKEKWVDNEDDDLLAAKETFQGDEEKVYSEAVGLLLTMKKTDHGFMWVGYF